MKKITFELAQFLFLATACVSTPVTTNLSPIATPIPPTATSSLPAISEIAAQARSYTVRIQVQDRFGNLANASGIIIDNEGRILTNSHVVEGAATIEISFAGRPTVVPGRLIGVSTCDDLAVLQITGLNTGVANFGNSNDLKPGDDVIAIGFPLGAEDSSVSRGIVSRLRVSIDPLQDLIQTDASVNPGNSGGPLINREGKVIGIITAKTLYDRNGNPVAGIAYAISSNHANLVIPDLGKGTNRNCQPPLPQLQPQPPTPGAPPVPTGACRSRLWGKIVDAAGQVRPNTQVDIVGGNRKGKTTSDSNGLWGFDELCAGDYSISITPKGGQPQLWPNKVTVDEAKQVKVDLQVK